MVTLYSDFMNLSLYPWTESLSTVQVFEVPWISGKVQVSNSKVLRVDWGCQAEMTSFLGLDDDLRMMTDGERGVKIADFLMTSFVNGL